MRILPLIVAMGSLFSGAAYAASIGIASAASYIHGGGALITQLDTNSANYFSTLNANNLGTFGWSYTNSTGSTIANFTMFGFLDADIDSSINTFFNEYGNFIDLSLPPGAPGGSIAASSWQIDEPGFVFGTIINDLIAGSLRNENFVPSTAPDDVSTALGFVVGDLAPGQTATLTLQISTSNIGGLQQVDPDSNFGFYFNGYATTAPPPVSGVPEPDTWVLWLTGVGFCWLLLASPDAHLGPNRLIKKGNHS